MNRHISRACGTRSWLRRIAGVAVLMLVLLTASAESVSGDTPLGDGSPACATLADPLERGLCRYLTAVHPDGLLTNWEGQPDDHTPLMRHDHVGEDGSKRAISESASMLALYAALIGDQTTFDLLFNVCAPAEIGGTGERLAENESDSFFASSALGLLNWQLDEQGDKLPTNGPYASAEGESSRWLEALSIADQKFPNPKYRLFANSLAWGLMGATDLADNAIGHFEDPGTLDEPFDDYVMRHEFTWAKDFVTTTLNSSANLAYNNMMGWEYAAQLGREPQQIYETYAGAGGIETLPIGMQVVDAIRIDMTERISDTWGYSLWEIEAYGPFTTTNLLLINPEAEEDQQVKCSASSCQDDGNCPDCRCEQALDGNMETRWSSLQPVTGTLPAQSLEIRLPEPMRVMTLTLKWEKAYATGYEVSAEWPFDEFYGNVLSSTADLVAETTPEGWALPITMYETGRHFHYPQILTPNLCIALPVTVSASSVEVVTETHKSYPATNAFDGNKETRWSSDWSGPDADDQWIAVEFAEPVKMDSVVLRWEAAYGEAFTIDTSMDTLIEGATWNTVFTETAGIGGVDVIKFPSTQAQLIRMHGATRGIEDGKGGYSLWEFEVYDSDEGVVSSVDALDLGRRAAAYGNSSGDQASVEVGQGILDFYQARYPNIADRYVAKSGTAIGHEISGSAPIMADLAELAAACGDCQFASEVLSEYLRPTATAMLSKVTITDTSTITDTTPSFDYLEILLALRHYAENCPSIGLPLVVKG